MTTMEARDANRTARLAGALYLTVVVTGFFSLIYVPSQTVVPGDPAATVSKLQAATGLFQLSIVAALICYTAFLLLPLVLYRLLGAVNRNAAVLMVAFATVSVPISVGNVANKLDTLSLMKSTAYQQAFTPAQLQAQVMLTLDAYRNGMLVAEVFWGLWLLPFGYLVFTSGRLPKILGVLLMMGGIGYLIDCVGNALAPGFSESTVGSLVSLPAGLGEIGTCLWLLIAGVREPKSAEAVANRDARD